MQTDGNRSINDPIIEKMIRVLNLLVLITPLPQRISCIVSNHPGISIPVIQSSTRSTDTQGHFKWEYQAFQRPLRLWYWILDSIMCTLCSPNVPEMHADDQWWVMIIDHHLCCQAECVQTINISIADAIFSEKDQFHSMKLTEDTIVLWNSLIIWVGKNKKCSWMENNTK